MPPSESVRETLTMEKPQQEIRCTICEKSVALRQFYVAAFPAAVRFGVRRHNRSKARSRLQG
jgi:hypothetical protein